MSNRIGLVAPLEPIELKSKEEIAADQELPYEILENGDILTDVQFMKPGTFVDSFGTEVTFTEKDLRKLARNFKAQASGQDVPIDINHAYGEAAGWVREVHFKDGVLVAGVAWNAYGQSLLFNRIYRYMSATVEIPDMVLHTISLTNFPAIKGLESADTPFDVAQYAASEIGNDFFTERLPGPALQALSGLGDVVDVTVASVKLQVAPQVYRDLAYEQVGNTVHFSATPGAASNGNPWFSVELQAPDEATSENQVPEEGTEATVTVTELAADIESADSGSTLIVEDPEDAAPAEDSAELAEPAEEEAELAEPVADSPNVVPMSWAGMPPDAKAAMFAEFKQWLEAGKEAMFAEALAEYRVEQEIVTFADTVTAKGKTVLPVKATRIATFLRSLNAEQRKEAMAIFSEIHEAGAVPMEEIGTAEPGLVSGKKLPDFHVSALRAHLNNGGSIGFYLRANGIDADEYDLSAFTQVEG